MRHDRPPSILFVLEYYYPHVGGVETLFANLAEALAQRGYHVTVVTLRVPGTERHEVHNGVEIVRVQVPGVAARYLFTLWALPEVWRRAATADLIHTTTYNASVPAWLAAKLGSKPVVVTVHEVFARQWNELPGLNRLLGYGFRLFEWLVLHLPFRHYLCDSEFTRRRLLRWMRVPPGQASVVYPAVDYGFWDRQKHRPRDLRQEFGLAPETFLYLYFGRPGISKGVEYLLPAARRIYEAAPASRLVLLLAHDPPPQYRRTLAQIDRLGLKGHVILRDPVPRADLPGYLLGADCVVVPSLSEGFGYAAVEAATLGCPVVTTTGHSVEEVVGDCVWLVPPRDSVALAEAVLALAREPAQGPRLPGSRYTLERHVTSMVRLYDKLLSPGPAAGAVGTDGPGGPGHARQTAEERGCASP